MFDVEDEVMWVGASEILYLYFADFGASTFKLQSTLCSDTIRPVDVRFSLKFIRSHLVNGLLNFPRFLLRNRKKNSFVES